MNPSIIPRENACSEYPARFPPSNLTQIEPLESMLRELLANVLRKGFYGTAGISITVNDGIIQHVRSQTDQVRKYETSRVKSQT